MTAWTLLAPCEFSGFDEKKCSGAVDQAFVPGLLRASVSAFPLARSRPGTNALTDYPKASDVQSQPAAGARCFSVSDTNPIAITQQKIIVVNTPPQPQWSAIQPTPVPAIAEPNA